MDTLMSRLNCLRLCKNPSEDVEQKRGEPSPSGCLGKFFLNPVTISLEAFLLGTISSPLEKIACENDILNCTREQMGMGSIPWIGILVASGIGGGMLFISYACYCCNQEKSHNSRDTLSSGFNLDTDADESETFSTDGLLSGQNQYSADLH